MTQPPDLFDRNSLLQRRARASASPALFLHEAARDEIEDRLSLVNKSFHCPAIVTPFPEVWTGFFPEQTLVSDEDTLALNQASYDLVIHAMALHWANDPIGQLVQCRHALKPDGLFLGVCPGGQTLNELRAALGQAEIEVKGGLSPRVSPMAEIRDLGALLQRAGFALPVADGHTLNVEYQTALHLMRDLRAMGETNVLTGRIKHFTNRRVLLRATEIYAENFGTDAGRIRASYDLITLTGWAPAPDQPQPLRPGSAQRRLADALRTTENPLKD